MRFVLALTLVAVAAPAHAAPRDLAGWPLYERLCLACHGSTGDGRGPAAPYTSGRPRSFAAGNYEWRSTAIGDPPTDDDLRAAIRYGAPGTSMPRFGDVLDAGKLDQLIDVVKAFSPRTFSKRPAPMTFGRLRPPNAARGAELWISLACDRCHGATGKGDGPAARAMAEPPYDLTAEPLRRPRATDDLDARRTAAAASIATGMAGTAMPGYGSLQAEEELLWALADHVIALGAHATPRSDRSALDPDEIAADRTAKLTTGTWPGADPDEARLFGDVIHPQGPPPASLAPAEASLSSQQCGRCHAKQRREWQTSIHAAAGSPGLYAQLDAGPAMERAGERWRAGPAMERAGERWRAGPDTTCRRCHTPLAEQRDDRTLGHEGVTCASCHVRAWGRNGPPNVAPSLASLPGYPLTEMSIYERSDFCMACHQLPPRTAVAGKPLLNTYKEWLEGPYMRRGIQCQSCHMPNREHQWLGVHDRDTFRQAIRLAVTATRSGGVVHVTAELANIGAGHDLPTTTTPAAWLRIELLDAHGIAIDGGRADQRIGRDVWFDGTTWHQRADTRIAPGDTLVMARAWSAGRTAEAARVRVTLEVAPDDYYEGFYTAQLRAALPPPIRAQYEQALTRARSTHYLAEQRELAL